MGRSERLIKLGDSWYSAKHIKVWPKKEMGVEQLNLNGGFAKNYSLEPNYEYHL